MALFNLTAAADALEDHLDHERKMILSGQIDGLLRASGEKERLLARLPQRRRHRRGLAAPAAERPNATSSSCWPPRGTSSRPRAASSA